MKMDLILDLDNFDTAEAEGSRYVLTSPRSLEACSRMQIRPVQLLPKPLDDFVEENPGKPLPLLQVFHDNHELKRVELLQKCRETRKTIIMENKVAGKQTEVEGKNGIVPSRSRTLPRQSPVKSREKDKLAFSKSLGDKPNQDENNNSTNGMYEVIPSLNVTSPRNPKNMVKQSITPRKFGEPLTPGRATFKKSKSKSSLNVEEPYMISTPIASRKFPSRNIDRNKKTPTTNGGKNIDVTPRSRRSLSDRSFQDRKRSKSMDVSRRKLRSSSDIELASSLKFANSNFMSGCSTPQQQKDHKIVEMMKEKRKQIEETKVKISEKQKEWDEEKRMEEKRKRQEQLAKERSLRQSQMEWEKRMKEKEERRVRELIMKEQEKQRLLEETEKQIERQKREQERMQRAILEERRKSELLKKQQQEAAKKTVEIEIQTFQKATEREIDEKLEKAQRSKLEKEMKGINKLQFLNKSQRERFLRLEKELKKRNMEESEKQKTQIQEKMEKADILRTKKLTNRDHALKQQAKEEEEKIQKTKEKQEELNRKNQEQLQSIAEHKKELLKRANTAYFHNVQTKAKRAQKLREVSQDEQQRRRKEIEKQEEKQLADTMEQLEAKDTRSKTHQQLKEAAIQLSRANARAAEAARSEVKQKDDTFLEASKHAAFMSSIGRGPRTGLVNASSVKFG